MKRFSKSDSTDFIEKNRDFIDRLVAFDTDSHCSFILRILNENPDLCAAISHMLDRYLLSIGKDSVLLPEKIYDKAYDRVIDMISHDVATGKITAHFPKGGYTDFYNISRSSMVAIAESLMNNMKR